MTTAQEAEFPSEVWIGKVRGEWPLAAFATEGRAKAWAGDRNFENQRRYVVGPIPLNLNEIARTTQTIPAKTVWIQNEKTVEP